MPRGGAPQKFPQLIEEFNAGLEDLLKNEPDIILLDTWSIFANEQGAPSAEDFPDSLHPSAKAYSKWAAVLRPIIQPRLSSSTK
jgi:beta-glucosidase